uniref:Potassium channel domain-containing protein n=1 Tax=Homalodisca liturata TaxID=320908 RepID=A0A1B6IXA6_9HEMI
MEEEARPHRCTTIVYYAWKIFTCLFTHVMLVTAVVAYCILGAYTFERLERNNEIKVKNNITFIRKNVTEDLWVMTRDSLVLRQDNWTGTVINRLRAFESELVVAMRLKGWDGSEDLNSLQWTFHGALFYSIIVITTIGYGHIAPKTDLGKVTTIFYAIMGIPLMLLCLSNIGDIMANSFRFLYWRICCYACTQPPKRSHPSHRRGRSFRSTVRTHGSGRTSGRSRTSSLRKHGPHGSQRSADSALALSEMTHSYSDTECRYYDEGDEGMARGPSKKRGPGPRHHSVHGSGRYSEPRGETLQIPTKGATQPVAGHEDGQNAIPVLFNKYALDREESCRVHPKNGQPHRVVQRGLRAQTAEPCTRSDMEELRDPRQLLSVESPPVRSSSLRQTYPGRRSGTSGGGDYGRERSYSHHRSHDYDYDYDYYMDNYVEENTNVIKPVPIWLCVFLVISYIIGGAFLFAGWENWNLADSAYFCFITLTTIGFGDFVPAQRVNKKSNAEISIALCSLYLLFGIALLAMSFNLVQEEVISNVKSVARNLGIIKDESDDDDY